MSSPTMKKQKTVSFISTIRKNRGYGYLLFSNIINRLGDALDTIVFMWIVYAITKNPGWSAVIFGVNQGVSVIFQPLVGPLIEKWPKKKVLIGADLIRAILVSLILLAYVAGTLGPWLLLITTVLVSLIEAFRMPASVAIVQTILDQKDYDAGISLNVSSTRIAALIGMGGAGILINKLGSPVGLFLDALIFFLSAVLVCFIPIRSVLAKAAEDSPSETYLLRLVSGFRYITGNPQLVSLILLCVLINVSVVPFDSLLAPMSVEMFHSSAQIVSLLSASVTVGIILGALLFAKLKEHWKKNSLVIYCGILLGLYNICLVVISQLTPKGIFQSLLLLVTSVLVGIGLGLMNTYVQTAIVKRVSPDYISRVSSIRFSISYACAPIVSFLLAGISSAVKMTAIFGGSGIIIIVLFLLAHFFMKTES